MTHAAMPTFEQGVDEIRRAPRDAGTVELIVRRPVEDAREVLEEARLDLDQGLVGDRWRPRADGSRDTQLTLTSARALDLLSSRERARWPLAGDQLYVDLDLSGANLPPGTRLSVGSAVIEISAEPHTGCGKFARRFGVDALKFVNSAVGRELNLRGVNARVVQGGTVRRGDTIRRVPR